MAAEVELEKDRNEVEPISWSLKISQKLKKNAKKSTVLALKLDKNSSMYINRLQEGVLYRFMREKTPPLSDGDFNFNSLIYCIFL